MIISGIIGIYAVLAFPLFFFLLLRGTRKTQNITIGDLALIFFLSFVVFLREYLVYTMYSNIFNKVVIKRKREENS